MRALAILIAGVMLAMIPLCRFVTKHVGRAGIFPKFCELALRDFDNLDTDLRAIFR